MAAQGGGKKGSKYSGAKQAELMAKLLESKAKKAQEEMDAKLANAIGGGNLPTSPLPAFTGEISADWRTPTAPKTSTPATPKKESSGDSDVNDMRWGSSDAESAAVRDMDLYAAETENLNIMGARGRLKSVKGGKGYAAPASGGEEKDMYKALDQLLGKEAPVIPSKLKKIVAKTSYEEEDDEEGDGLEELDDVASFDWSSDRSGESTAPPPPPKKLVEMFKVNDFAPLEIWSELFGMQGENVDLGRLKTMRPLVVVADPRGTCAEFKQLIIELNGMFPKSMGDLVTITPDSASNNRKLWKKSSLGFPVFSDPNRRWMNAYRVTELEAWGPVCFIIEPQVGRFLRVMVEPSALAVVQAVKEIGWIPGQK